MREIKIVLSPAYFHLHRHSLLLLPERSTVPVGRNLRACKYSNQFSKGRLLEWTITRNSRRIIKKDRDLHLSRSWRGNLLGYLEKVKEDPTTAKLAHARLYDRMMKAGVRDIHESGDPHVKRLYKDESIKVYDFFADEFFGIEKTISQIVRYFHAASLKGEESRQVLYLMGPVGSGKSSLVEKLHQGFGRKRVHLCHRRLPNV